MLKNLLKKYKKIFQKFWGYSDQDIPLCFACNLTVAVDIHHLKPRGMGGNKKLDVIDNLIPLCRPCHVKTDYDKNFNSRLVEILKGRIQSKKEA